MHKPEPIAESLPFLQTTSFDLKNPDIDSLIKETYFSLGKLDGILTNIPHKDLLLAPIVIMESVKSSNIESIHSTVIDQLEVGVKGRKSLSVEQKLTANYKDALLAGFDYITKTARFDLELILLVQKILLPEQSGIRDLKPVVIANTATGEILHRPPVGKDILQKYLENWVDFANNEQYPTPKQALETKLKVSDPASHGNGVLDNNKDKLDPLIKVGVLHAQFESIHPFVDGNGRTGRLLIILFLIFKKVLSYPCLFISDYILRTRTYYYMALQDAQKESNFQPVIEYILSAILEKSQYSQNLIEHIKELQAYFDSQIKSKLPLIHSSKLIEYLFINPFYSISGIQSYLKISRNTASKYLYQLSEIGLIQYRESRKNKVFYNPTFLKLLS